MMYSLAIICPPLAVLFSGKPVQALINFVLTLCFYLPGLIHAFFVVNERKADKRLDK
ncbi:YqaE/Pmp3 family membrane protein [Bacillus sp. MHSD_36]|uniref:YqaE/Pmp3 family membrane protein n=1 Tax=unclassified Bacillus (in: firmicutes) TaxID=185979 RepID=UPI0027403685|nr:MULTISPECIES: YqaE/Pmp3 family membrane protein [unclassified Bacillus (in: firmicutes)]MDP7992774.1 YqaE/Pmp3 family membrane protein [Bacillus sp. MHSD_36]MDR4979543.1 YqaE/Pmp3 family membrane protein [Bacillus sp. MHSD_37]